MQIKNCYVENPTHDEAVEIVERAMANGVECWDAVTGMDVDPDGASYNYNVHDVWGIKEGNGTYTHNLDSDWAESATKLTMDEYRAMFSCAKYDVNQDDGLTVGNEYILTEGYVLAWCEEWVGEVVILCAVFKTSEGDMVAVENKTTNECACFAADMLKPIRTDRERFIEAAKDVLVKFEQSESARERMAGALHDAGFKAPEGK